MRLLLISLCSDKLSELEFVKPIEDLMKRHKIDFLTSHYTRIALKDVESVEKIIICGTALKDESFLAERDRFEWLREVDKPILGIGSGLQVIAKIFNCRLINAPKIGAFKVRLLKENKLTDKRIFYSYFLTKNAIEPVEPLEILAKTGKLGSMVKHNSREIYGCLFHPEVMNPEIILNFAFKV